MEMYKFERGCIIGKSKPVKQIFGLISQLARQEVPVLIQGESGTGKELVATAIHSSSPRSLSPFIKVNCAALDESWVDVEFFGSKGEAGTDLHKERKGFFEIAAGGTILLDEITNLPKEGQGKLVQVLHEGRFIIPGTNEPVETNVRIIATSNKSMDEALERGMIREDLYACLKNNAINMPVLRRLREDIPLLVKHFIDKYSTKHNKGIKGISSEALAILMEYDWPGNVKELENCVEQAVLIENLDIIQADSLPYELFYGPGSERQRLIEEYNLRRRLKAFERQLILRALNEAEWKKKEAATLLGIDQRNLSYFLKKHCITDPITRLRERGAL